MQVMQRSPVISISEARQRPSRIARAIDARRRLGRAVSGKRSRAGRMWVNGVQLGEVESAFAHLAESYD